MTLSSHVLDPVRTFLNDIFYNCFHGVFLDDKRSSDVEELRMVILGVLKPKNETILTQGMDILIQFYGLNAEERKSKEQIASELGISLTEVSRSLHEAMRKLRDGGMKLLLYQATLQLQHWGDLAKKMSSDL